MKTTTFTSGNFSANGNLSGYNSLGERFFVHKRIMDSLGIDASNLTFPLFALVDEKEINPKDEDGNILSDVTVKRAQALSVFKTMQELIDAKNADFKLDVAIQQDRAVYAKDLGLTDSAVNALLAAI